MIRSVLLAGLMIGTACSAQPQQTAVVGPAGASQDGPQGPQPPGADAPVPKNAPLNPAIHNVAATTGRANLAKTPPPFLILPVGRFEAPFAMAFLPDGALLVTEKAGKLKLRQAAGTIVDVGGLPAVADGGQGGLLDIAVAPDHAKSGAIYLSYAEPRAKGSALALARARLDLGGQAGTPRLSDFRVIWRAGSDGPGGQFGGNIAFSPDGRYLFLSSGERQRFTPAQDPQQALGKILRLTLDGKAVPGNPNHAKGGVEAMTWSSGHRNPYGIAFTADGRLWEEEMGPKGGDELNLIEPERNYGWPVVSNGDNYSGQPIPDHPSRPDLAAPVLWWNPSMSPGGMIAYSGAMFPQYKGSLFIAALSDKSLIRVEVSGTRATAKEQWDMVYRIRDVAQAPDGAIWVIEDGERGTGGRLLRLTAK